MVITRSQQNQPNMSDAQPVVMSPDQFSQLLATLTANITERLVANANPSEPQAAKQGNFVACSSRFDGKKGRDVNAFVDAVCVYKDCANVSDENALKGFSMLLTDDAATWWRGVKHEAVKFDDALRLLQHAFGQQKPAYKIYREIFAEEQDLSTRTDIFINKKRALFAQLQEQTLTESVQIDMLYGLLHREIRERVPRNNVKTFSDLLEHSRCAEETLSELQLLKTKQDVASADRRLRCSFCKAYGHDVKYCRKLEKENKQNNQTSDVNHKESGKSLNTKFFSQNIVCYGCGTAGYIKSNCPKCQIKDKQIKVEASSIGFYSMDSEISLNPKSRPVLMVEILGVPGRGFADTAAKQSVAGHSLYKILKENGQHFTETTTNITLADGKKREEKVLLTTVTVKLCQKEIPTTFVIMPAATNNSTLLGIDFLKDAGLVLDIQKSEWYFADEPQNIHKLLLEDDHSEILFASVENDNGLDLRAGEGHNLDETQRREVNKLLKVSLTSAPVLRQADNSLPFIIRTDASDYAIGAVLVQGEGVEERPVEYVSRLLSAAEKNYNTTEREALAVVYAVSKFRGYIEGSEVTIGTDHQALRWLMSLKSPSGRLARWALALQPYNLKITYVPGKMENPDQPVGCFHLSHLTPFRSEEDSTIPTPVVPRRKRGRPRKQHGVPVPSPRAVSRSRGGVCNGNIRSS